MDKNKSHDFVHLWYGGKAENCPYCCGRCSEEEMMREAAEIAMRVARPTLNPNLPYDATLYAKEEGTSTTEAVQTVTAGEKPKRHKLPVMTDVMSFAEDGGSVPTKIKIIPTGKFKTPQYGDLEITPDILTQMKQNFEESVRAHSAETGLPIDIEHGETSYKDAAAGWMKRLDVQDNGLYAEVEWTPLGEELLRKKLYKFFSPEFMFDYVSNEQSILFANVVSGGGLVNKPLFDHSLEPIVFSENGTTSNVENLTAINYPSMLLISKQSVSNDMQSDTPLEDSTKENTMDLQTILAKESKDRSSEEQAFVVANLGQLTREQKIAEGFLEIEKVSASETTDEVKEEVKVEAPAEEVKAEASETPAVEVKTEEAAPAQTETVTASEKNGQVVISAAEYNLFQARIKTLEEEVKQGVSASEKLKRVEITEKVKGFVFSEKGGKIAPANVDPIVNLALKMGEDTRAEFFSVIESLPDKKIFGEQGSDQDLGPGQAKDLFESKVREMQDQNKGMTYGEAVKKAIVAHPDLYNSYQESLKPATKAEL